MPDCHLSTSADTKATATIEASQQNSRRLLVLGRSFCFGMGTVRVGSAEAPPSGGRAATSKDTPPHCEYLNTREPASVVLRQVLDRYDVLVNPGRCCAMRPRGRRLTGSSARVTALPFENFGGRTRGVGAEGRTATPPAGRRKRSNFGCANFNLSSCIRARNGAYRLASRESSSRTSPRTPTCCGAETARNGVVARRPLRRNSYRLVGSAARLQSESYDPQEGGD